VGACLQEEFVERGAGGRRNARILLGKSRLHEGHQRGHVVGRWSGRSIASNSRASQDVLNVGKETVKDPAIQIQRKEHYSFWLGPKVLLLLLRSDVGWTVEIRKEISNSTNFHSLTFNMHFTIQLSFVDRISTSKNTLKFVEFLLHNFVVWTCRFGTVSPLMSSTSPSRLKNDSYSTQLSELSLSSKNGTNGSRNLNKTLWNRRVYQVIFC
jgi:hypothetical protein